MAELDLAGFEARAGEVAGLLKSLGNPRRLMILCKLAEFGEMNVGALAEAVGLSQSALSQHLALLREEAIVAFRREGQTIWYNIADGRVEAILAMLHRMFCKDDGE